MKRVNKFKSFLALVMATLIVGSSCSKKTDDVPVAGNPKILSFGFYAEDNEDNLFRDYVVENVTGTAITIALPKDADKSKLVARFTTSENVTVAVGSTNQVSGSTALNFSAPVDYIATEKGTNARYTVTITNAADYVWSRVGAYAEYATSSTSAFDMQINPKTSAPYFLFKYGAAADADQKAYVAKYENGSWSTVGTNVSEGNVNTSFSMVFNNAGTLYITYPDYSTTPSQAPVVKKYDGTSWSTVGGSPVFAGKVSHAALAIHPTNNQPLLFNNLDAVYDVFARRIIVTSSFNGSNWTAPQLIPGRPSSLVGGGILKAVSTDDAVYFASFKATAPNSYSLYMYKDNTWSTIVEQAIEEGATGIDIRDFNIAVAPNGDIYVIAADNASGVFRPRVKKYSATTKAWSQVGSLIDMEASKGRYFSIAISPSGIPHVIYRNDQNFPTVLSFNSETQDWNTASVLSQSVVGNVFIDFANNGTGYASFADETSKNIVLYKFDVPAN